MSRPKIRQRGILPARARWLAALALGLAIGSSQLAVAQQYPRAEVIIHGHAIAVDVADTLELQVQGLSGRRRLAADEGMIFVYDGLGDRVFWMRGMFIPIDIIWLSNTRVVHIEAAVPPPRQGTAERDLPTYRAPEPSNLVLELAAGRARELGLKAGDRVEIRFR